MKITIDLCAGADHITPTKGAIQHNIVAQHKILDGKPLTANDHILLLDTITILDAIKRQLPE